MSPCNDAATGLGIAPAWRALPRSEMPKLGSWGVLPGVRWHFLKVCQQVNTFLRYYCLRSWPIFPSVKTLLRGKFQGQRDLECKSTTPRVYGAQFRTNRFVLRSAPIVVVEPWPGSTMTSSPSGNNSPDPIRSEHRHRHGQITAPQCFPQKTRDAFLNTVRILHVSLQRMCMQKRAACAGPIFFGLVRLETG